MSTRRAETVLLIGGLISSLLLSVFLYLEVSKTAGVKSVYGGVGIVFAIILLKSKKTRANGLANMYADSAAYKKTVWLCIAISITVVEMFNSVDVVVFLLSPVVYTLIFAQYLISEEVDKGLLVQVLGIFFVLSYAKLSTTYFYIGNLDLISHSQYARQIVQTGSTAGITRELYADFPGLPIVSGTVSMVTGVIPHDSIVFLGVLSFMFTLVVFHKFLHMYTGSPNLAFLSIFILSNSAVYLKFSNYFFPESLAVVFFVFVFYASVATRYYRRSMFTVVGMILVAALSFTHHLTYVLFLPAILVILTYDTIVRPRHLGVDRNHTLSVYMVLLVPYTVSLYYWSNSSIGFLAILFNTASQILSTFTSYGIKTGGRGDLQKFLGDSPVVESTQTAVSWLVGIDGIYNITIVALTAVGFVTAVVRYRENETQLPLVALGAVGVVLLLDTPLSIKSASRIALPFGLFVAVVAGMGLKQIEISTPSGQVLVALLILLNAVTGPAIAYDVRNYSDTTDPLEYSIDEREFEMLRAVSEHIETYGPASTSSFLTTRIMLEFFGLDSVGPLSVEAGGLKHRGYVVYRAEWSKHRLLYRGRGGTYLTSVRMSDRWLSSYTAKNDVVYTSGQVGIVSNPR